MYILTKQNVLYYTCHNRPVIVHTFTTFINCWFTVQLKDNIMSVPLVTRTWWLIQSTEKSNVSLMYLLFTLRVPFMYLSCTSHVPHVPLMYLMCLSCTSHVPLMYHMYLSCTSHVPLMYLMYLSCTSCVLHVINCLIMYINSEVICRFLFMGHSTLVVSTLH